MQVSVEQTGNLERKVTVQVPAERVEDEVTNRLRNLARRVRMDGFRPGKVPFKVVQKRYDGQVRGEVLSDLVQQTLSEALRQENLRPAGGPRIEPKKMEPGQALEYSAIFEVYPQIELASLDSAAVEKPAAEVTDADVDKMLEKLRTQRATWNEVEREAREGDQITVNFEGSIDGQVFAGGKGDQVPIVLGSGTMIEGFESQLEGAKAGEHRTVDVRFPDDYRAKEVAGKDAKFEVDVVKVAEPVLPEMDDDFAQAFGVKEGGVEALRSEVRGNMERELEQKVRAHIKEQVLERLLEANEIEVPKALVDEEITRLISQATGKSPEELRGMNLPREAFEERARKRVALGLLIGEVINKNELQLDADRVSETLNRVAASYEDPEEVIQAYRKNPSLRNDLEAHVMEEQVVDLLVGQMQVKEKRMAFDDLMNEGEGAGK